MFGTVSSFIFTKYVQPARLPNNLKTYEGPLKLAGWGVLKTTVFIPDLPSTLQEVNVTYIPYDGKSVTNLSLISVGNSGEKLTLQEAGTMK